MIVIDTDIFAIYHIFKHDPRFEQSKQVLLSEVGEKKATTIYNLLELYGICATAGLPELAEKVLTTDQETVELDILTPVFEEKISEIFFAMMVDSLTTIMKRGVRHGDAKILWVAESSSATCLITWNKRHFHEKTKLEVLTPEEYLSQE